MSENRGLLESAISTVKSAITAVISAIAASPEYEIRRGQAVVAILIHDGSSDIGHDHASLIIDGSSCELRKDSNEYDLRLDSKVVASAKNVGIFRSGIDVVWGLKKYKLKQTKAFSLNYTLLEGDLAVGSITWSKFENPNLDLRTIDLPDEIALEVQVFLAWIVISLSSGGGGGGGDFGGNGG